MTADVQQAFFRRKGVEKMAKRWIRLFFRVKGGQRVLRILSVVTITVLSIGMLVGCGSQGDAGAKTGTTDAKTVIVGTGNGYEPYCYLDNDGNLAGYEYEVLKAVNELLPQYKFEYQTYDFANVLLSLDAGKIDIGAHQYEINEERQKKYLFGKESYTTYTTYITVAADNDTIHSLADLQGKKVMTSTGSNTTYLLEKYNAEHADHPIELVYVDHSTDEETVVGIKNHVWDATVMTKRDAAKRNRAFGNGTQVLKQVGDPIATSHTYWVYRKDNPELQEAVDGALKKLKESGKLAEISKKVLGDDYTESE